MDHLGARLALRKILGSLIVGVVLLGAGCAAATPPDEATSVDPIVVVDSFLAARNARDPVGAADWFAALLAIDDGDTRRFVDRAYATQWLRGLTDAYVIDTLIRPDVERDKVAWTERLTPRTLHFPDSLAASVQVDVLVIITDGRIVELRAGYPAVAVDPLPSWPNALHSGDG